MDTRAVALISILLVTHCSEWVPAGSLEAMGQERVRVQRPVSLDEPESMNAEHGVVTSELAYPSRRTLQRLRRQGAYFEVRRSNADKIALPLTISIFGAAVVGFVGAAVAALYRPSFSDVIGFGGALHHH